MIKTWLASVWQWILGAGVILATVAAAFFLGNRNSKSQQDAAVDAARSEDVVAAARIQAEAAHQKAVAITTAALAESAKIASERARLPTADTSAIDEMLRQQGILK